MLGLVALATLQFALNRFAHEVSAVFGLRQSGLYARERPCRERGDHLLREFRFSGHGQIYCAYKNACQ
jgi:hypothetical protein